MYGTGEGVAEGLRRGGELVPQGRRPGQRRGAATSADLYENGRGVAQDDAEAMRWYRKAADQGNAERSTTSACCTRRPGVAKDDAEAMSWFRKAADQGNAAARPDSACMYADGRAWRRTTHRRWLVPQGRRPGQ